MFRHEMYGMHSHHRQKHVVTWHYRLESEESSLYVNAMKYSQNDYDEMDLHPYGYVSGMGPRCEYEMGSHCEYVMSYRYECVMNSHCEYEMNYRYECVKSYQCGCELTPQSGN